MTPEAQAFKDANDQSLVVSGSAIYRKGLAEHPDNVWGGSYTLEDGRNFKLPSADLRTLPDDYPKWKLT